MRRKVRAIFLRQRHLFAGQLFCTVDAINIIDAIGTIDTIDSTDSIDYVDSVSVVSL